MPYTLKTQQIAVKDPDTGVYSGVDILTEQTTEGLLTEIIATGNEVKTDVAAQMATERSDFNTYVSGKEAELDQYKSTTETNINTYVTNKNQEIATMIADADEDVSDLEDRKQDVADAVAGMLSKGVDNTLTTANVPAESKATGDLFETIVEGKSTQPNDKWNRLWIKPSASDYEIPTMDEFNDLKSALKQSQQYGDGVSDVLLGVSWTEGRTFNDDCSTSANASYHYSDYIPVENDIYRVVAKNSLSDAKVLRIIAYDSNKQNDTLLLKQVVPANSSLNSYSIYPYGYSYIRVSYLNTETISIINSIESILDHVDKVEQNTYGNKTYQTNGVGVSDILVGTSWTEWRTFNDDGTTSKNVDFHLTDYIPIIDGQYRIVTKNSLSGAKLLRIIGYDINKENGAIIFRQAVPVSATFITYMVKISGYAYIRVSYINSDPLNIFDSTHSIVETLQNYNALDIYPEDFNPSSNTMRGVKYTWYGRLCSATGTATGYSASNLFNNTTALPKGFPKNKPIYFDFVTSNPKLLLEILYYDSEGTYTGVTERFTSNFTITIPNNVYGMSIRLRVDEDNTVTGTTAEIKYIGLHPSNQYMQDEIDKINVPYNCGMLVSFVDDDATSTQLVEKYYQACKHNGIVGNYAVIKNNVSTGNTSLQTLLEYEDDGFGLLTHCTRQTAAPYWQKATRDIDLCRADLREAINYFRENDFVGGYRLWVSPYGDRDAIFEALARQLGLKCNITLVQGANYPDDIDRYCIKRATFRTNQDISVSNVKIFADKIVKRGYGWLIVTTHFNEWGDVTWDLTLDSNGYQVGYAAFNTMVQYLLNAGFQCVSVPEGFSYYEPYMHN